MSHEVSQFNSEQNSIALNNASITGVGKMSDKHTPLPWRLRLWPGSLKKPAVYGPPASNGGDYAPICEADEDDARLIVKACNSHDALLHLANAVRDLPNKQDSLFDPMCMQIRAMAIAAIELVEKGSAE